MFKALNLKRFFSHQESKQQSFEVERKSAYSLAPFAENIFTFANNSIKWMQYYITVAPVGDAVDKLANRASKIPVLLYAPDKEGAQTPITKHPFLTLLKKPNPFQTQEQFIQEYAVHQGATGNNYVRVMGLIEGDRISSEPVEMYNLRPDLMVISDGVDYGRPTYYQWRAPNGSQVTFYRRFVRDINGNFVDAYIELNGFSQLYHFKNISTGANGANSYGSYQFYGDAPLQSAEVEINQYFEAALYNYFLIKNGLSAKTIASPNTKDPLDVSQLEKLRTYMQEKFTGSVNSGKMIVSTIPLKIDNIGVPMKDMDFKALEERTAATVYRKMEIPLPLVDADNTSYANMETSYLMLYDNGVLPALDTFCANMFTFLFAQRYKDADKFTRLGYNPSSVAALQPRIAATVKLYKETGDTTVNERREYMGLSRIPNAACDEIYIPQTMVPIGTDVNLSDTIGTPSRSNDKEQRAILLRKQKNPDGTNFYSEKEIHDFVENIANPLIG